jgi:hypothetical protein
MSRQGFIGNEDPNLETRLLRMEGEIAARTTSSGSPANSAPLANNPADAPRQVTGITIKNRVPGAISVKWVIPPTNVDRFEVQFSDESYFPDQFQGNTTFKYTVDGRANYFVFTEGDPDVVYYCRVRAVSAAGNPGPFSSTLNLQTGKATATLIGEGETSSFLHVKEKPGKILQISAVEGAKSTSEHGNVNVQIGANEVAFFVVGKVQVVYELNAGMKFTITPIFEDIGNQGQEPEELENYITQYGAGWVQARGVATYSTLDAFDPRPEGNYRFRLRFTLENDGTYGTSATAPRLLIIEEVDVKIVQLKR